MRKNDHNGAGKKWHAWLMSSQDYRCESEAHDPRCEGMAEVCHHIVLRSHLITPALWLIENSVGLSTYCHLLAHSSHGASLSQERLDRAVKAVNAVVDKENAQYAIRKHARIQPFFPKPR